MRLAINYITTFFLVILLCPLATYSQDNFPVQLENEWNIGITFSLEHADEHNYFAHGSNLKIVDVREPANPDFVAEIELPASPSDLCVYKDKLYVAMDRIGIYIYDVSIESRPLLKGYYYSEGIYQKLLIDDGKLFFINDRGLEIADITQDFNPEFLNRMKFDSKPNAIASVDNYLLVSTMDKMEVIRMDETGLTTNVGSLDLPFALDILVVDGYAIVPTLNHIYTVDVRSPESASIAHEYNDYFQISSLAFKDNYIYGTSSSGNFVVYEISDGELTFIKAANFESEYLDIKIDGNYAYAILRDGGMEIFSIANLLDIRRIGFVDYTIIPWM